MVATIFTSCKKDDPAPLPVADFTFSPAGGVAPVTITFTNTSLNATSYLWDFGGGITSTEINPVRTAVGVGSLTVTLTATGPGGVNKITKNVVVRDQTPQEKIIGRYKTTAISITSGGVTTNGLTPCLADDITEFNINNQLITENGALKCNPTEPTTQILSYSLASNGATITIELTSTFNVIQLTRTVLQLRITDTGGTRDITLTKI